MAQEMKEIIKDGILIYRLSFGNTITSPNQNLKTLLIEQGLQKEFSDGSNSYYLTLRGIKVNRKIYQPTEIEAEVDFMQKTTDAAGKETTEAPSFSDVTALLLNRQVKVEILHVDRVINTTKTLEYIDSSTVAENCYVYELNPQLKHDVNGSKMYVKLNIFSMDKLMTLNKYSKAYVARKLGEGILEPESLNFGTIKEGVPLIETDYSGQRFLQYPNGDKSAEFIQPYLVQYNESFYDFMVRTANRCGEFLYFEDGKLILGLPDSNGTTTIDEYDSVTVQKITGDPLEIKAYRRDSVKDGNGTEGKLNQSVIERESTGFPFDAFPEYISSNSELATDEYIFPLYKDKFSNQEREMYYDGDGHHVAMAHIIPIFRTLLANDTAGVSGLISSLIKHAIVSEGIMNVKALLQVGTANDEGFEKYLKDYEKKTEQHEGDETVQFAALVSHSWTNIHYYNDIHKHEVNQQRKIICINMGTNYIPVKLGQEIKVPDLEDSYVVIQIQQISEEAWSRDYEKYETIAADKFTGKRFQKIYAIPSYNDGLKDQFIPPVQPVPMIRKVGPQTAFVTDNEDPKRQGRVRIAFPWQSESGGLKNQLDEAKQQLEEVSISKGKLMEKKMELLDRQTALKNRLDELKQYVNATNEERIDMLKEKANEKETINKNITNLKTNKEILQTKIDKLEKNQSKDDKNEIIIKEYKAKIREIDNEIADKNAQIEDIDMQVSEMKEAAKEHDEKKGNHSAYKDIEKDNVIIKKYKDAYDTVSQQYREAAADYERKEAEIDLKTAERDKVVEAIKEEIIDMSTPWVRIASPMATPGGGTFFRPQNGDEVLVNFDCDNIERPYVVGSLFSKNNLTPDEYLYRKSAPEIQWKDISMSLMSPNGHHITFTDPKGGGKFISNALSPGIGFYASVLPGLSDINDMGENFKELAGGIHIGDTYGLYEIEMNSHKRAIVIQSPFGTVDINAFSGITISAPNGNVKIQGKNITLEAGNKITMLSGKNILDPEIEDPEGKANTVGKAIVGTIDTVLAVGVAPDFIESIVDFSLIRHIVEVFARPVDGTLLLKSKRYLKLEAGLGNATIRPDRYANEVKLKKESSELFFRTLLDCVNHISSTVDIFYSSYRSLWKKGYERREAYMDSASIYLKHNTNPNIVSLVQGLTEWKDDAIKADDYNDCFKELKLFDDNVVLFNNEEMFNNIKKDAVSYGRAVLDILLLGKSIKKLFDDAPDTYLGDNVNAKDLMVRALTEIYPEVKDWEGLYDDDMDFFLKTPEADPDDDPFASERKTAFKRKLLLSFLDKVSHSAANEGNKYFKTNYSMDAVIKTKTLNQEYYWKRQIINMDHYWQKSKLWRTIVENTISKFADKFMSNFAPLDRDIWIDKPYGQILFSDQEGSTLNFQKGGLKEEKNSNIGTFDYLKKTLMGIK